MPLAFTLIPGAFLAFGIGWYLASMTSPGKLKTDAGGIERAMPNISLPRSQLGCVSLGVRAGRFYSL